MAGEVCSTLRLRWTWPMEVEGRYREGHREAWMQLEEVCLTTSARRDWPLLEEGYSSRQLTALVCFSRVTFSVTSGVVGHWCFFKVLNNSSLMLGVFLGHISHWHLSVCIVPDPEVLGHFLSCQKRASRDISEEIFETLKYMFSIHCSESFHKCWAYITHKNSATWAKVRKLCTMSGGNRSLVL